MMEQLYRLLLRLYPSHFRQQYGEEMVWVLQARGRDLYRQGGWSQFLWFWLCAILDLSASGLKLRFSTVAALSGCKGRQTMNTILFSGPPGYGRRVAQVLHQEPAYGATLVTGEPTRPMTELVDSLLLDCDPTQPETALALFQGMGDAPTPDLLDDWQAVLREAARRAFLAMPATAPVTAAERLLRLVYSDPTLYQLVAAADPGESLYAVIDLLALDCDIEDIETTLRLIRQLTLVQ